MFFSAAQGSSTRAWLCHLQAPACPRSGHYWSEGMVKVDDQRGPNVPTAAASGGIARHDNLGALRTA